MCDITFENDDVYMASVFEDFIRQVILKSRGVDMETTFEYDAVSNALMNSMQHKCHITIR